MFHPVRETSEQSVADCMSYIQQLESVLRSVVVGQEGVIRETIIALLAGGNALLEGVPGLGKTLLVRTLAEALDLSFSRIQFTPDLMPADITGTTILREDERGQRSLAFQPGPIFAHLVLADEINRATPKTQSALLEAMQEATVTIGTDTHRLPAPFLVLATQNPLEMEGTYPLPEAQLDRFLLKILVPFPAVEVLRDIARQTIRSSATIAPILDAEDLAGMMRVARDIPLATPVLDYAVSLVIATQPDRSSSGAIGELVSNYVRAGVSPRGLQALVMAAQAQALMEGRYNVSLDDVQRMALPAMRHRILLNFAGQAEGLTPDSLITDLLSAVPTP